MTYGNIVFARFLQRPNRFTARVEREGTVLTVHVKNTGRCRELLRPGARVALAHSDTPKRKTAYDLVAVHKESLGWVNIDSQAPNRVVKEWLKSAPSPFQDLTLVQPEYPFGHSRVDFYLECGERRILLEVKGCTLEIEGVGYFPDAPTLRGVKHLRELTAALSQGYESWVAFVISMPHVTRVLPNEATHPEFAEAFDNALLAGVNVLYLPCRVTPGSLAIAHASILEPPALSRFPRALDGLSPVQDRSHSS